MKESPGVNFINIVYLRMDISYCSVYAFTHPFPNHRSN